MTIWYSFPFMLLLKLNITNISFSALWDVLTIMTTMFISSTYETLSFIAMEKYGLLLNWHRCLKIVLRHSLKTELKYKDKYNTDNNYAYKKDNLIETNVFGTLIKRRGNVCQQPCQAGCIDQKMSYSNRHKQHLVMHRDFKVLLRPINANFHHQFPDLIGSGDLSSKDIHAYNGLGLIQMK